MKLVYQSMNFAPEKIVKQYVKAWGNNFRVFDVDAKGMTLRERDVETVSSDMASEARQRSGLAFSSVEVPRQHWVN